jgi:hypothetical protein
MLSVTKIETEEQSEELYTVLSKVRDCDVIVSLRHYMDLQDGRKVEEDIEVLNTQTQNVIWIDDRGFLNVTMRCGDDITLRRIQNMWTTAGQRNHERNKQGKDDDYFVFVDLVKAELEVNRCNILSMAQPLFASFETAGGISEIRLVFILGYVSYEISNVSLEEVEYEVEQEADAEFDRQRRNEEDNKHFDENDGLTDNADLLGNNRYNGYHG